MDRNKRFNEWREKFKKEKSIDFATCSVQVRNPVNDCYIERWLFKGEDGIYNLVFFIHQNGDFEVFRDVTSEV